jgi:hypothetical protein
VSLRNDLHAAFDELEPEIFGMPERVVETVFADRSGRMRRKGMILRLKAPLSLVAVLVLIALVVGALIGGRLVQDWNARQGTVPAGGLSRAEQIAELEARPWQQPLLTPGAACPDGPKDSSGAYGSGPFRGLPGRTQGSSQTAWGFYWMLVASTDAKSTGLMLVRTRDLRTGAQMVFVGRYATGPVVGTDNVAGVPTQQHAELLLDMSHPPTGQGATGPDGQTYWQFTVGAPGSWPDCVGWQIDGIDFTETFAFKLNP